MKQSLFRTIRRKLLEEGKLLRYLTYALGEILLIVVGILLALKISDWNEDRKEQAEFDLYIVQLKEDVKLSVSVSEDRSSIAENRKGQVLTVLNVINSQSVDPKELEEFEGALNLMDLFSFSNIRFGYLVQLLDGDIEEIARDKRLSRRVLTLAGNLEGRFRILEEMIDRTQIARTTIARYRGRRRSGVDIAYDLEKLRASDEFKYAAQNIYSVMHIVHIEYRRIKQELEDFLTTLEDYE